MGAHALDCSYSTTRAWAPQVPLANRWNRWPRRQDYRLKPVRDFRVEIDAITSPYGVNSYGHIGAWFCLTVYMKTCPFSSIMARCCLSSVLSGTAQTE
ncbi:hypothetical protein PIB30_044864 [Stylosanthes scabra]|uniref:Uncharacterized protein n=1 Tax=Stylosanthes scabra TaxID=79078 RepID=A0ABU6QFC7_9FABA|nr:hypothetical protein [Stylosanthes scabra]